MSEKTKENILMFIIGIIFSVNVFWLQFVVPSIEELISLGWVVLVIGALFIILSISTLRIKGTASVTDSGVYGIVRHPMYLGGMVMFFSHIFFGQNRIITISTIVGLYCCYLLILSEEQRNIKKFGDDYRHYMQRVPRMNFVQGFIGLLQRRKRG